jgi:hypothetical protein
MLEVGVIHPSTSPYSLPVVMVLKKEGTWCMCPNFLALNKFTIKNKFLILIFYNLLVEIHRVNFFTKLSLHLGYHQIRMKVEDIPNIASTFQSLMNKILKHFLCNFVIVFFDDILIYSKK